MRPGFLEGPAESRRSGGGRRSCNRGDARAAGVMGMEARRGGAGGFPLLRGEGLGSKERRRGGLCLVGMGGDGVATGAAIYSGQGVRGERRHGRGAHGRAPADAERLPGWPKP